MNKLKPRNWDEMIGSGPCRILVKNGKILDPKYQPLHPAPDVQPIQRTRQMSIGTWEKRK